MDHLKRRLNDSQFRGNASADPDVQRNIIPIDGVQYRTARTRRDYCEAFRILQRRYLESGLAQHRDSEFRVLPYHLWDETQTFVAVHRGIVVGSISLIRDGETHGLPMQSTFGEAIQELRDAGFRLGEVCSLTVDSPATLSTGDLFGHLTRLMMFQARHVGLDYLLAVVHPRHARFYRMAMGFEPIGMSRSYGQVGGLPGTPILGSVNDRSRYRPRWRRYYFEGDYTEAELRPRPMPTADKAFFKNYLISDYSHSAQLAAQENSPNRYGVRPPTRKSAAE